jgi:hypothetical protein
MTAKQQDIYRWVRIVGLVFFLSALFLAIVLASRMRLSGDDYCYRAVFAQEGFWGMQARSFMEITMYNGNRFSLTFFAGLAGLLPPWGGGAMVILALLAWLAGLVWVGRLLAKAGDLRLGWTGALLVAGGYASFVLWAAPNPDQSFYWLSGMLPYFMPLVGGTLMVGLALHISRSSRPWAGLAGLFLLALITGGFSETGAAFQGGFWALVLSAALLSRLGRGGWGRTLFWPAFMVLLGTLAALALLYFSPSTRGRLAHLPAPLSFEAFLSLYLLNLKVYFWNIIMRRTLTVLVPLAFGLGLGAVFPQHKLSAQPAQTEGARRFHSRAALAAGVGLGAVFLAACVILPGTYVFADYPPDRAFILSQAALTGAAIVIGGMIALGVRTLIKPEGIGKRWVQAAGLVFLIFSLVGPVLFIRRSLNDVRFFTRWARMWDARHTVLVQAAAAGADDVHVIQLDHVIQDVGELSPDPGYWYNNCAEMYYGVDRIYADQPGW